MHNVVKRVRFTSNDGLICVGNKLFLEDLVSTCQISHLVIVKRRHNGVSSKPIEDLAVFLHEEGSVIDNGASEKLLKDESMAVLSLCVDLNDTIDEEEKFSGTISGILKCIALLVSLGLHVVHDVVHSVLANLLQVFNLFQTTHCKLLQAIIVSENALLQLIYQKGKQNENFFVSTFLKLCHCGVLGRLYSGRSWTVINQRDLTEVVS